MRKVKPYNLQRDGVTYSLLSSWLSCRQQCRYRLEGWTSIRPKDALNFGNFFHDMLRVLYDHYRIKKVPATLTGLLRSAKLRMSPWIEAYVEQHSRATANPDTLTMLGKHAALCEMFLPLYITQWEDDFRKREWLDLESEFDVRHPMGDEKLRLRGKRDGVFRKKKKRGIWLLETKTKGRIEKDLVDTLSVDAQNLLYLWATYLELGEMPIGVDYNIIRRPSIKQRAGETHNDYATRVAEDITSRPETYFVRMEAAYAPDDVLAFGEQLSMKIRDFRTWAENMDEYTYRNETSCVSRWTCDYLPVCASGSLKGFVQTRLFSELGG